MSTSKCKKYTTFGPFLEVGMLKKCSPLWREAHFEVNMLRHHMFGRSTAPCCTTTTAATTTTTKITTAKAKTTTATTTTLQLQQKLQMQLQMHYKYTTLHYNYNDYNNYNNYHYNYTTLQIQLQLQLHYTTNTTTTTLHYTTLHSAVVGEVTTATTPKHTIPNTFRFISLFALPSMHHKSSVSYLWNFRHHLMRYSWQYIYII